MTISGGQTGHEAQSSESSLLHHVQSFLKEASADVWSQRGHLGTLAELAGSAEHTVLSGGVVDDREYLLENIIQLASSLPNESKLRENLDGKFIRTLWDNLQHPPVSYLGHEYRSADGSGNNISQPGLGAAGSYYARTVPARHMQPSNLPEPSVVFDALFARQTSLKEHPNQISSTLFHFAAIITHDIFHTDELDNNKNKCSSYLDLGPLYGRNQQEQDQVRTFTDGLLKNDTFADYRFLSQPPGVVALLIAFNRFHNYIVKELLEINEGNRFSLPPSAMRNSRSMAEAQIKRDNDLFQTGRLITCGLYVNIILNDYLRAILNLNQNPMNSDWRLDPRDEFSRVPEPSAIPRAGGNQVSAEFNMIYRWHSAVSEHDEEWLQGFMTSVFGQDVDPSELPVCEFIGGLRAWFMNQPRDPSSWNFGGIDRQQDGRFRDSDLISILRTGTESLAGAFGPWNVPKIMKAIECLGIQQGRKWRLATLNEVRLFFKLKPYDSFVEINSDPTVAETLETLYGHPDNVELYAGLTAEEAKKTCTPGSGLCPGYTISTAILSDAVALVRGDRFYTVDYTPANLTAFGFTAVQSEFEVAEGGVMHKLLMRAFPAWYRANSVYALYPFTTPTKTLEILQAKKTFSEYNFDPPSLIAPPIPVTSWQGVVDVLEDQNTFKIPWTLHIYEVTGHEFMLSGDSPTNVRQHNFVNGCLYGPKSTREQIRRFYEVTTDKLIRQHSRKLGSKFQLDIVKDIGELAHIAFVSHFFKMPISGNASPADTDAFTARGLADILADLFAYVFLDTDVAVSLRRKRKAVAQGRRLGKVMERVVADVQAASSPSSTLSRLLHLGAGVARDELLPDFGAALIQRLLAKGNSPEQVAWIVISTAAGASATQAQGWAQMLDLYLSDDYYARYWPEITRLAADDGDEAFAQLERYALEGFRLSTPAFGVLRIAAADTVIDDADRILPVQRGSTVFADFVTAGRDPQKFPDPAQLKLDRPLDAYIHHGWGAHACLGRDIVTTAGAAMLRSVARLTALRRAPGPAGEMHSKLVQGAFKVFLKDDGSDWSPFPVSKKVIFDDFGSESALPEPAEERSCPFRGLA